MLSTTDIMLNARRSGTVLLAFNVPYLPMIEPVIKAVVDNDSFALVEVARLEWTKFEAGSLSCQKRI
jgi:fructose-bisphosphate aldolase, class II